ncbi:MAG: sugar transferase [Bacillota bacterium]
MPNKLKKLVLFGGDIIVLHFALAAALFIRYRLISGTSGIAPYWSDHWKYFLAVFAIFLLVFYINNLYSLRQMATAGSFARRTMASVIAASLISVVYFYAFPADIAPKTNLALFAISSLAGFLLWRRLAYWLTNAEAWRNNIAIIGYDQRIESLVEDLKSRPSLGYHTALIFKDLGELDSLKTGVLEKNIRTIILADDFGANAPLRETLFSLLRYKVSFISYEDFYEQVNQKVPVESINQGWFLDNLQEGDKNYFDFAKKISDYILAALMLIISLPFWPLIAFFVVISSKGPVFFFQDRVGKDGETFRLYKFRTMTVSGNDGGMTKENDKRITPIGGFLRTTRIDEIPQLINILRGEMSFIGPRPERPEYSTELEKQVPFYSMRLLVKPGLTGWDQISGEYHSPSIEDTLKKLQNDLYYIKHRSIYLDFSIILKTVMTVLMRKGI